MKTKGKTRQFNKARNNSSSFSNAPFNLSKIRKQLTDNILHHGESIITSGNKYYDHKALALKSLKEFKTHFIRMNYNLELDKYIKEHNSLPSSSFRKQLYQKIENDFNKEFSKNGKEILSPFKKGR